MADSKLQVDNDFSGDVVVLTLSGQMLFDDGDLAFRRQIHVVLARDGAFAVGATSKSPSR